MSLPCLDGLFIKCRVLGRKGPLEGTPRSPHPGVGSAWAPNSLAGTLGKSPSPRSVPPTDTKRAQEARGAGICQFQRSVSDSGRSVCQ